jgi:hypothetical protein
MDVNMTNWVITVWDGFSNNTYDRKGSYDEVRMTCAGYPPGYIWSIEDYESYVKRMADKAIATAIQKKFLDGTAVTPEYEAALGVLISGAIEAEKNFSLDELEEFAGLVDA